MSFRNLHKHKQKPKTNKRMVRMTWLSDIVDKILNMNIVNIKKPNHYNDCKKSGLT